MPYAVQEKNGKFVVINKDTGKVKGTHPTKSKATAQMRLLYGIEHGMKVRNK
jgi:hypothetical protein